MNAQHQEQFHQQTLNEIALQAINIKRAINEKADSFLLAIRPPSLQDKGMRFLGVGQYYRYFECTACSTTYPEMDGEIRMNGRAISHCPCQTTKH